MALKLWQRIVLFLAALLNWISLLALPVAAEGKDPSWELALAHFLRNKFQAGVDYIYTYGPLGYVLTATYDRSLYWLKYGWEVSIKLLFAVVLWKISRSFPKFRDRLLFLLVAAAIPPFLPSIPDAIYLFFLFAGCLYLPAAIFGALCGVLALTKFSFIVPVLFLLGIVTVHRRSPVGLIVFAAVFLAFWITLGQSLSNLPIYLSNSWQIMNGYVDAFAKTGPAMQLSLALAVALLLVLIAARLPWPPAIALGGAAFVAFKHGFVRQDWYHAPGFFAFAALAFASSRVRPWVQNAGVAVSLVGLLAYRPDVSAQLFLNHWKDQASALVRPIHLRNKLDREYADLEARFAVPQMREKIGAGSVDLMGGDQRRAIFNHLDWRPRPVFEGWQACAPKLLAANAAFLRGGRAPDFVIASWNQIDERLPAAEDGAALLELLARYEPVERENGCHLFRRTERVRQESPAFVKEIRIGETLELDSFQTATFEIKYSLLGKLRWFFYKPAPAFVRVTLASGETKRYRLAPSIAASEFLLNPLLENLDDIVALCSGPAGKTVKRLEIEADKLWFDQKIKIILREFPLPQRAPAKV